MVLTGLAVGEIVLSHLADRVVNDPSDVEGVEGPGNEPEMPDREVGSFEDFSLEESCKGGQIRDFREITMICGLG